MNWISIKDKLPPKGEKVLTYGGWGLVVDEYATTLNSGIVLFKGDREEYNDEVTYWIPMPELPKDK